VDHPVRHARPRAELGFGHHHAREDVALLGRTPLGGERERETERSRAQRRAR
jgi:hypothetical protein